MLSRTKNDVIVIAPSEMDDASNVKDFTIFSYCEWVIKREKYIFFQHELANLYYTYSENV